MSEQISVMSQYDPEFIEVLVTAVIARQRLNEYSCSHGGCPWYEPCCEGNCRGKHLIEEADKSHDAAVKALAGRPITQAMSDILDCLEPAP